MQNPYDRWLEEFMPEGSPSIAQVGEEGSATDDWLKQLQPPPVAPQAPGVPVPPPAPMTQSRTPNEYVKQELDAWWKLAGRNVAHTFKPTTLKDIAWELVQPVGFFDKPQGTDKFDRAASVQAAIDYLKEQDPTRTDEDAIDILKEMPFFQPYSLKTIGGGDWTIFPTLMRDAPLYLHGMTQAFRDAIGLTPKTEDITPLGRELIKKWDFSKPEAREEFKRQLQQGTALLEYGGDLAAGATILGRAAGATGSTLRGVARAKAPPSTINQINKKLGLPENAPTALTEGAIKHHLSKHPFARAMDKAGGHLQAVDTFLNDGGLAPGWYSMPTKQIGRLAGRIPGGRGIQQAIQRRIDPETGRFEKKTGLADIVDPELWAIRTTLGVTKAVGTRALSPFADMVNNRMVRLFQKHGVDPKTLPASLMSRSDTVATKEGMQLNLDEPAIVEKMQTALRVFQAQAENIADQLKADGDITKMGTELEKAFENYEREFSRWARHYRNQIVPGSENVIADLTPIFQLRQQMEIERQRLHPSGAVSDEPSAVRYLDDLIDTMQRTEQAGLTPEAVQAIQQGQPPPTAPVVPGSATPLPQTIGAVRTENQLGLPYRTASSGDYKSHYNVEYKLIPGSNIVTSHLLTGEENPLFRQIAEHLGYGNLQPREFKRDFVRSVAADLQPMGYLADMRILDRGAPIVVEVPDFTHTRPDGTEVTETVYLMLSGNNRTLALELARQEYPEQYARYRAELEQEIGHYGFEKGDITTDDTALFRVLTDKDANLAQLVDQSNTTAIRLFDAGEQSEKDKEYLNQDILQRLDLNFNGKLGDILQNATNIDAVFEWLKRFNAADRGNMTTTEVAQSGEQRGSRITTLTEQGVQRLVNALFRRTFDGSYGRKMMELFVTRQDSDIKNIENGVINALQDLADLQIGTLGNNPKYDPQYQIAEDLAQAVVGAWQMVQEGQQQGLSKAESIRAGRQQGELLTGMARITNDEQFLLLDAIVESISSPAVLTNFIQDYVAAVRQQATPGGLFDDQVPRSVLVEQLHYEYFREAPDGETISEPSVRYAQPTQPVAIPRIKLTREQFLQALRTGKLVLTPEQLQEGANAYHATLHGRDIIDSEQLEPAAYVEAGDLDEVMVNAGFIDHAAGDTMNVFFTYGENAGYKDEYAFIFDPELLVTDTEALRRLQEEKPTGRLEIVVPGEIPLNSRAFLGMRADGETRMLTEESRGKPPDEWEFLQEEAPDPEAIDEGEPDYAETPVPISPLQLWHASRRQQEGTDLDSQRQAQKQQRADDTLSEVEQLYFDFEEVEPTDPPTNALQGIIRKARRATRKKLRSIIAPVMNSKRPVSIEWEGLLPGENYDAAVAELNEIVGLNIVDEETVTAVPEAINRDRELEMMRQEPATPEELERGLFLGGYENQTFQDLDAQAQERVTVIIARQRVAKANRETTKRGLEVQISKQTIRNMQSKLEKVFEILEKHGAEVNDSAGFHVHVDKTGMSAGEMGNIAFAWLKYEWAIVQQPGWQNTYSRALTQEAMGRNERIFGVEPPPEPMLDPDAPDADVVEMERLYLKNLQDKMRKGHSVMLNTGFRVFGDDFFGWKERDRLNLRGTGEGDQTIEFRQGDATLDIEQAMKNVAFALGFVEKFKNRALKPGVRPPMAEALRQVLPTGEETTEEYYQRLHPDTEIWDNSVGRTVNLIDKLKEWDADPNIAYLPSVGAAAYPNHAQPTYKGIMHALIDNAETIAVVRGFFDADGTFKPDTTQQPIQNLEVPSVFDTNPLVTWGKIFDPPDLNLKMKKLLINILDRVTLPLVGMRIDSPRELAVVTQALRANFESTRVFLYDSKNQRIVGYKVVSLNRTSASTRVNYTDIAKLLAANDDADSFFMMHNHPGGSAYFSKEDVVHGGDYYIDNMGDQYLGQIVIDSGEFAYQWQTEQPNTPEADIKQWDANKDYGYIIHAKETLEGMTQREMQQSALIMQTPFSRLSGAEGKISSRSPEMENFKNLLTTDDRQRMRISVIDRSDRNNIKVVADDVGNKPRWRLENNVPLTKEELGWNPARLETPQIGIVEIKQEDPRFTGSRTKEARTYGRGISWLHELVNLAKKFQIPKNWIYVGLMSTGRRLNGIIEITGDELKSFSKDQLRRDLSKAALENGASHLFIMIGEGDWYSTPDEAIKYFLQDNNPNDTIMPDLIQAISVDNHPNPFQATREQEAEFAGQRRSYVTEQELPEQSAGNQLKALLQRSAPTGISEPTESYSLKGNAERTRSDEGRTSPGQRSRDVDLAAVQPPVTYGQLEAWRTYMRRSKEQHEVGSPQHVAAGRMEKALTEAMERSMMGFSPEMWEKLEHFYRLYKDGAVSAQSKVAKAIRQNAEVKGVEGTSNYARMAQTLFSPGDTPENIGLLYRLIGGFDSEAGKQIRAVFLESMIEGSRPRGATLEQEVLTERTAEARQNLENAQAQVAQARSPAEVETAQQRVQQAQEALDTATEESRTMHPIDTVNPLGLSGELEKWLKKTGKGYKRKTLDAILGKEVVDALIDLRDFEQSFARLKAGARGSRTAPWFSRWLDNDVKRARFTQVIQTLTYALIGGGTAAGGMGMSGIPLGSAFSSPIAGAFIGIPILISAWLGAVGVNAFIEYMKGKPVGERYLLEGTVVALDHVLTRTPVLASPEQARAHRAKINAEDYAGPRELWELARPARFIPKVDDEDED